ncbi:hypothetical protein CTEN210_13461 [Chaetoceros tenuissimus]|uniref:Phosphatidylserine decarboxylase n=1 Tax=Chaetoceros tenuissimus TaxID=426638 RepID=A0AAD3D580_9STRA|nr:hypothetical protein CTEN210_13461 [Chaetoceros tenuissimus]
MWLFQLGDYLALLLLKCLPKRISTRIQENASTYKVYNLSTKQYKTKPRMTFFEAVFATILFDLALFGTSNPIINFIIAFFTHLQNSWDKPFKSKQEANLQITEFCNRLRIQSTPWIWEKPMEEYISLNDFFSRTYLPEIFPLLGKADMVSPASCTMRRYNHDSNLQQILIKGCDYRIEDIGLPHDDLKLFKENPVLIGYLSPTDYHRVHSPIAGKITHLSLEGADRKSASVKFFDGKFNLLNENKRLVIVIETNEVKVSVVVIGGIGVDTIAYNPNILGQHIDKGQELSAFRAGGSAIAVFTTAKLEFEEDFEKASENYSYVEVHVGESLANFSK